MVRRGSGVRVPSSALLKACNRATSPAQPAAPAGHEQVVGAGIGADVNRSSRSRAVRSLSFTNPKLAGSDSRPAARQPACADVSPFTPLAKAEEDVHQ